MKNADVVIVGSGPAGVSAAWPLVQSGVEVIMIDAGTRMLSESAIERPPLSELRRGQDSNWKYLLGEDLRAARDIGDLSARLKMFADDFETSSSRSSVNRDQFHDVMIAAHGGLSNVWGAVCCALDHGDIANWPVEEADLRVSYRRVASRIGISGPSTRIADSMMGGDLPLQQPLPLSRNAGYLHDRYDARLRSGDFSLAQVRSAVLTEGLHDRAACRLDRACMLGCATTAVYNSGRELRDLSGFENFQFVDGIDVQAIERQRDEYTISGHDTRSREPFQINSRQVVMAAGTMNSTKLTLQALGKFEETLPLQNSPAVAVPFWIPRNLGCSIEETGYGMAQLAVSMPLEGVDGESCFGLLYDADVFPISDIVKRMPVSLSGGRKIAEQLISSLMIGLFYFPGKYSNNNVRLARPSNGSASVLHVQGAENSGYRTIANKTLSRIKARMRKIGAYALPASDQFLAPGSEVHCGATLPMGEFSDRNGQIDGLPGYYVVDGAVLPSIPAKNHTFTIMANADRIGSFVASNSLAPGDNPGIST